MYISIKKNEMETLNNRIAELKNIQSREVKNNFKNGNLWNECEDKINNIMQYGQESEPKFITCQYGYEIGYVLENGEFVEYVEYVG